MRKIDGSRASLCRTLLFGWMLTASSPLFAGGEAMTLRINDAIGVPGERVAVVLRTYAPRGISQGQICFSSNAARPAGEVEDGPFLTLEEAVVFSEAGDAQVVETFNSTTQTTMIELESASATINWDDGPMAVLFFRLSLAVSPGEEYLLELDVAETFLFDADGQNIALEPRSGALSVKAVGAPHLLSAEGDSVPAGGTAILGVETEELFAVGAGRVALRYDPAVAAGPPAVSMDPRHGAAAFAVEEVTPGRVVVSFSSPGGSLNGVPGQLVTFALPTVASLAPGTQSAVSLDAAATFLEDPAGLPLALVLGQDVLEIEPAGGLIFADGFEAGDLRLWSNVH